MIKAKMMENHHSLHKPQQTQNSNEGTACSGTVALPCTGILSRRSIGDIQDF